MTETVRIATLFKDLYDGSPWLDVNLLSTLADLTSEQAAFKAIASANSIWEIVNHLSAWRVSVLERLKGKEVPSPEHNYFLPVEDFSAEAWQRSIDSLAPSQAAWLEFLQHLPAKDLDKYSEGNKHTFSQSIHGILQHDAYHLGQIMFIKRLLKEGYSKSEENA